MDDEIKPDVNLDEIAGPPIAWLTAEMEAKIKEELDGMEYAHGERRKAIQRNADMIAEKLETPENNIELKNSPEYIAWRESELLCDTPVKVPMITYNHHFTVKGKEVTTIASMGQYYKGFAYDPTLSEAFDTGFLTAILLVEKGLISLDGDQIPKDVDDDNND